MLPLLRSLPSHGWCHPERAAALRMNLRVPPVASWPITVSAWMTYPLRSTGIIPLLRYYEVVRPLVSHPYSRPRGFRPLVASPLASTPRFPRSAQPPLLGSAHLHAGSRSVRKQVAPELIPRSSNCRGFDIVLAIFDTKYGGSLSVLFLEVT